MQLEQLLQFINKYMPIFEVINFYNSTRGGKIKGGGKKKAITLYLCLLACLLVLGVFAGLLFGLF